MTNPWLSIPASDYDRHLSHPTVLQRQFLDRVFSKLLKQWSPTRIALLGCATGGGLDSVDANTLQRLIAIDLNPEFLAVARSRHAKRLPKMELIQADLERCELDLMSFDLVHCGLVLEYVEPGPMIEKAARWLAPEGVFSVVLQLPDPHVGPVTDTGIESLQMLRPLMKLRDPQQIRDLAHAEGLTEIANRTEQLASGKRFYSGQFRREISSSE